MGTVKAVVEKESILNAQKYLIELKDSFNDTLICF